MWEQKSVVNLEELGKLKSCFSCYMVLENVVSHCFTLQDVVCSIKITGPTEDVLFPITSQVAAAISFFPLADFEIFNWNMSLRYQRVKGLENVPAIGAISPASLFWLLWSCKKPQIFCVLLFFLQACSYFTCILLNLVFHFFFTFFWLKKFFLSFFGATPSFLTGSAGLPVVSIATGFPSWGVSDCPFAPAIYIHMGRELKKKRQKTSKKTTQKTELELPELITFNLYWAQTYTARFRQLPSNTCGFKHTQGTSDLQSPVRNDQSCLFPASMPRFPSGRNQSAQGN